MRPHHIARLKPDTDEQARRQSVEADVTRLVLAFARDGIDLSTDDAYAAWCRHSEGMCAGWLALPPEDTAIRRAMLPFLTVEERHG